MFTACSLHVALPYPADRADILFAIGYALRFTQTGKPLRVLDHEQAAARVLEQLERSGMEVYRRKGLPMPGAGPHVR